MIQFVFEAQLLPEDHRAGIRLELRGRDAQLPSLTLSDTSAGLIPLLPAFTTGDTHPNPSPQEQEDGAIEHRP